MQAMLEHGNDILFSAYFLLSQKRKTLNLHNLLALAQFPAPRLLVFEAREEKNEN